MFSTKLHLTEKQVVELIKNVVNDENPNELEIMVLSELTLIKPNGKKFVPTTLVDYTENLSGSYSIKGIKKVAYYNLEKDVGRDELVEIDGEWTEEDVKQFLKQKENVYDYYVTGWDNDDNIILFQRGDTWLEENNI